MKASELIAELQKVIVENGDLDVAIQPLQNTESVETIYLEKEGGEVVLFIIGII